MWRLRNAVAIPNLFQHCVRPFHQQDATRPGYRKILVFFVVELSSPS
jgi:hypothetical protein